MAEYSVTQPTANRVGVDEILVTTKAPAGLIRLRMNSNDALELLQQIQRALLVSKRP